MRKTLAVLAAAGALLGACGAARAQTFDQLAAAGQLALDTGRSTEAADYLQRAAQTDPRQAPRVAGDLAWAYVDQAYDALAQGDFAGADNLFTRGYGIVPQVGPRVASAWAIARLQVFWAEFSKARTAPRDTDWDAAVNYAQSILTLAPGSPNGHYALGMAYEWRGSDSQARSEYLAAIGRAAAGNLALDTLRNEAYAVVTSRLAAYQIPGNPVFDQSDPGDWQTLERFPFVIHHHNAEAATRVLAALDYYLSQPEISGFLEANPTFPCECHVFIYRNRDEYRAATGQPEWSGGMASWKSYSDKPRVLQYPTSSRETAPSPATRCGTSWATCARTSRRASPPTRRAGCARVSPSRRSPTGESAPTRRTSSRRATPARSRR